MSMKPPPLKFHGFRAPALYRFSGHFSNMYMSIKLSYHYSAADLPKNSEISGSVVVRFRTGDAINFASLRRSIRIADSPDFASLA